MKTKKKTSKQKQEQTKKNETKKQPLSAKTKQTQKNEKKKYQKRFCSILQKNDTILQKNDSNIVDIR